MSLPDMKPKRERNRLSLILQLGSSKRANDSRSPSSRPNTPDTTSKASPTAPFTLMNGSPRGARLLSPQRDYKELVAIDDDNPYSNAPVPPTLNELDSAEKANILKKVRKLSRVFGELVVIEKPSSRADGDYSTRFLEVGHSPRSSSTFSRSGNGRLTHLAIPRLPSQPELSNQILTGSEIQPEVDTSCHSPSTLPAPETFANVIASTSEAPKVEATDLFLDSSTTSSFRDADGHSVTSVESLRRTQTENPRVDENTLPNSLPNEQAKPRSRSPCFRRQSLDLDLLTPTALVFEEALVDRKKPDRSLSLRSNAVRNVAGVLNVDSLPAERKRVLNVSRARKMTQLFGDDPPYEMLHVTRGVNRDSIGSSSSESTYSMACSSAKMPVSASLVRVVSLGEDSPTRDIHPSSFQERRRRATKLAQFFGVAHHDITSSLAVPERTVYDAKAAQLLIEDDSTQLDVKISSRRRLWGKNNLRDANVMDARARLRDLKVA